MSLFFPFGLRLGGGRKADKSNVAYDGQRRAVPIDATSTYPRLRDVGKKPADNAVIASGQMLDFNGSTDYVAVGDIS